MPYKDARKQAEHGKAYYLKNKKRFIARARIWSRNNRDRALEAWRNSVNRANKRIRIEVINEYGGRCVCCSVDETKFLSIDHVDNDGAAHRQKVGSGAAVYRWLKKHGCPKDKFQLLCHNCNHGKAYLSACPHKGGQRDLSTHDRRKHARLRSRIIAAYGGLCACCKEDNPEFLTVDHINGNGNMHCKLTGKGSGLYYWLQRNGFPHDNYRLLCYNCNMAKGIYGNCHVSSRLYVYPED